jgi:hypothetical protein
VVDVTGIYLEDLLKNVVGLSRNAASVTVIAKDGTELDFDLASGFDEAIGRPGAYWTDKNGSQKMMLGWSATGTRVDGVSGAVSNESWTGMRLAVGQKDVNHRNYPLWIRDVAEIRVNSGSAGPGGANQETVTETLKADIMVKDGMVDATNTAGQVKGAVDAANKRGGGQVSKTLFVDATTQEGENTYKTTYTLPVDALNVLIGDGMTSIELITDQGSISLSTKLLEYLGGSGSGPLAIEIGTVDAGDGLAAADIAIRRGDAVISNFGGILLKINIPFHPGDQEDGLVVYHIGVDGSKTLVKFAAYDPETHSMRIAVNHLNNLSKYSIAYNPVTFDDIQKHWAKGYIEFLASRHIVNGRSADTFDPAGRVTRAEFAKMLAETADGSDVSGMDSVAAGVAGTAANSVAASIAYGVANSAASGTTDSIRFNVASGTADSIESSAATSAANSTGFSDIPADAWYAKYVGWAANLGIVQGYPDGTFQPDSLIAREEMAVMTERFIIAMKVDIKTVRKATEFADQANIGAYAANAIAINVQYGILNGNPDGTFNAKGTTSRAESAKVAAAIIEAILR